MHVLGTAGHVDHGKSTFLRALTAMEPDRLPEEKKRGMTIDLNFVWLRGPTGETVGIVDVPGHQSFIKNMISGVLNIDAFMLLVAADDGWMPQTEEHVQVLRSMRVSRGIAIITKVDLVDEARVAEVEREIRGKLAASFDKEIPVLRFSAPNQQGLEAIREALASLLKALPPPEDFSAARLWVDRVFMPRGLGVVVTGTLREGSLEEGQELLLLPSGKSVAVKGLQAYKSSQKKVSPVSRCAVQLSKIQAGEVARGDLLQAGRSVPISRVADAYLEFFADFKPRNTELPFHIGTLREPALVIPIAPAVAPRSFFARLKFRRDLPLRAGERFLLRTPGEEASAAGGLILDPAPEISSHKKALKILSEWQGDGAEAFARYELALRTVVRSREMWDRSVFGQKAIEDALKKCGAVGVGNGLFAQAEAWASLGARVREALGHIHADGKKDAALSVEILAAMGKERVSESLLDGVLEAEVAAGRVRRLAQGFQLSTFKRPVDSEQARLEEALLGLLRQSGEKPVAAKELGPEREVKAILKRMVDDGRVTSLPEDHFLAGDRYAGLKAKVVALLTAKGQATTSELREALNLSRKLAVLVLERLDRDRVTFLKDNIRKLLK